MDPSLLLSLLGTGASAGGGIYGAMASESNYAQAMKLLQQVLNNYQNLQAPSGQDLSIPQSALSTFQDNPDLTGAQTDTLAGLKNLSDQGGLQIQDIGNLNTIMGRVGREATARNAGALNQAAALGEGGAGSTLAAELNNNATADSNANQAGTSIAGQAQARALQAMIDRGNLAGNIRGQNFGEAAQKAQATDLINQYNAAAKQQAFSDQIAKLGGQTGGLNSLAQFSMNEGNNLGRMYAGIGQGVGQGLQGAAGYLQNTSSSGVDPNAYTPDASTPAQLTNASYQAYGSPYSGIAPEDLAWLQNGGNAGVSNSGY